MSQPPPPGALRERIAKRDGFNVLATAALAAMAIVGLLAVTDQRPLHLDRILGMVALVGISLAMLWWALDRMHRPEQRPDFARLARFGSTLTVLEDVERELQADVVATVEGWWLTPTWLVSFHDDVRILPIADVMGVARAHICKHQWLHRQSILGTTTAIVIWMRDEYQYQTIIYLSSHVPRAVAEMVARVHPELAVSDPVAFHSEWKGDRQGVQRRIDAARGR